MAMLTNQRVYLKYDHTFMVTDSEQNPQHALGDVCHWVATSDFCLLVFGCPLLFNLRKTNKQKDTVMWATQ